MLSESHQDSQTVSFLFFFDQSVLQYKIFTHIQVYFIRVTLVNLLGSSNALILTGYFSLTYVAKSTTEFCLNTSAHCRHSSLLSLH